MLFTDTHVTSSQTVIFKTLYTRVKEKIKNHKSKNVPELKLARALLF